LHRINQQCNPHSQIMRPQVSSHHAQGDVMTRIVPAYSIMFFLCIIPCEHYCLPTNAVTYELNGGRLGDNIQTFVQAFWISYFYRIPLLFKPFEHSEHLRAHHVYEHSTPEKMSLYKEKVDLKKNQTLVSDTELDKTDDSLRVYITRFGVDPGVDWHNHDFIEHLRALVAPLEQWQPPVLPTDMHTIALHIRCGGGFRADSNRCRKKKPLQFPSLDYYACALQILLRDLEGPCYVHIFTDDQNPSNLAQGILSQCSEENRKRITLTWRERDNRHNAHVTEDFFALMDFNYLIRPRSGYSILAEIFGHCMVSISPRKAHSGNPWGNVTDITITTYANASSRTKDVFTKEMPLK
jgi:hypothetical protein